MADYYPLLSRAVEALSNKSPEMRRAVYDRARTALIDQLRSLDPPLSEADITRERLALDEAIGQIEADHGAPNPVHAPAPPPPYFPARPEAPPAPPPVAARPEPATRSEPPFTPSPERRDDWPEAVRLPPEPAGSPPPFTVPERKRPRDFDDLLAQADEAAGEAAPDAPQRERPRVDTVARHGAREGRGRAIVLGFVVLLVVGAIAVAAWLLRDQPSQLPRQPPLVEAPRAPEGEGKTAERLAGTERPPAPPPAAPAPPQTAAPSSPAPAREGVSVAQRAIFYEENPAAPQSPKASAGRALWRLDAINAGQGQPLETAVRSTVEIPEAGITLNLLMRRNLDPTLPASHTIELAFNTGGDPNRTVRDVGLLQLKNEEAVRGAPVAGLPVPVKDNLFLIGLSNLPSDMERNKDLLLNRNWIDLPIRFTNGQRAIISFEKGISGEQVIAEAFRQWDSAPQTGASR